MISEPAALTTVRPGRRSSAFVRHPLVRLIIRRLIGFVFVVAVAMVAVFVMVQFVPGDPLYQAFGELSPARYQELRHQLHFDKSLFEQFRIYAGHLFHGDLGRSYTNQEPVSQLITERMGASAQLAGAALLLVLSIAIPGGILAAAFTREGRRPRFEVGFMSVTSVLAAIPDYLSGTILAFIFAVEFRLLPVAGSGSLKTLILPALAVSMSPTMSLARIVRLETLNVLREDYVRTARSQRLPAYLIYGRHVLPNVLTAALTAGGLIFASILGGAVIVERVFARAGLGSALIDAVTVNNYPVVQGITLLFCAVVVGVNMLIDITLATLDPRSLAKEG